MFLQLSTRQSGLSVDKIRLLVDSRLPGLLVREQRSQMCSLCLSLLHLEWRMCARGVNPVQVLEREEPLPMPEPMQRDGVFPVNNPNNEQEHQPNHMFPKTMDLEHIYITNIFQCLICPKVHKHLHAHETSFPTL